MTTLSDLLDASAKARTFLVADQGYFDGLHGEAVDTNVPRAFVEAYGLGYADGQAERRRLARIQQDRRQRWAAEKAEQLRRHTEHRGFTPEKETRP